MSILWWKTAGWRLLNTEWGTESEVVIPPRRYHSIPIPTLVSVSGLVCESLLLLDVVAKNVHDVTYWLDSFTRSLLTQRRHTGDQQKGPQMLPTFTFRVERISKISQKPFIIYDSNQASYLLWGLISSGLPSCAFFFKCTQTKVHRIPPELLERAI